MTGGPQSACLCRRNGCRRNLMGGRIQDKEAGRQEAEPLPWLYSIVGLSVLGWAVLAGLGWALGLLAARAAG